MNRVYTIFHVGAALCGCTESGPDGFLDLTLKFRMRDILDAIGSATSGDQVLTLTGTLLDGTPIEGQDCVVIVGGGGGGDDDGGTTVLIDGLSGTNTLQTSDFPGGSSGNSLN